MPYKLALISVQIFQFLSPDQVKQLLSLGKIVEKNAREVVLLAGEAVPGVYVIGSGSVGVYPAASLTPIAHLTTGQSFGEMSFIETGKASATIRAEQGGVRLLLVLHSDLAAMITQDPSFGLAFYHGLAVALSQKLRTTTAKISDELKSGRMLLAQLSTDEDGVAFDINFLPGELTKHNQQVVAIIDELGSATEELAGGHDAGTAKLITRLQTKIDELKYQYLKFYPRLGRQLQTIAAFIVGIEKSLLQASRD